MCKTYETEIKVTNKNINRCLKDFMDNNQREGTVYCIFKLQKNDKITKVF